MKHTKVYVGATFGLIFGVAALAPILPMPLGTVDVYATEGTTVEVATYADFYDAIVNGTADVVTLTGDITELSSGVTVAADRTVTINLNGYNLSVRNDINRGIVNNGNLTITGGGVLQNSDDEADNNSRGLIDNTGTLTIDNATLKDYGYHSGSAIRSNNVNAKVYINSGAKLQVLNSGSGNTGIAAMEGEVVIADGAELTHEGADYYPLQIKNSTVTIGTVGSENPAVFRSNAAGIYIYGSGKVTINSADIESVNKQAIRVESATAEVEINGGRFTAPYGGAYIYTTTIGTEPLVTINGGEFSGQWASIASTNKAGDQETWAFDLKGGVYAGTRVRDYLSEDYKAYRVAGYFENGWSGYFVEPAATENIPETIYMKKGTQETLGLSTTGKKYAELTLDKDGVIVLDGDTITSGRTGIVKITTDLNDGSDPIETVVYSYENLLSVSLAEASDFGEDEIAALDEALLEGENKLGYLDINYARVVDGVEIERLATSEEPMTILVEIPEVPTLAEGYERTYRVLYGLDGEIKEITDVTMNNATGKLGFETAVFSSPFLVTYTDTEIPVEPEPEEPDPTKPEEDPVHPVIPKDDTFEFDDPGSLDPLGETFTKPAASVTGATNGTIGVPNTSNVANSSEINLLIAMMIGSTVMTGAVLGLKRLK